MKYEELLGMTIKVKKNVHASRLFQTLENMDEPAEFIHAIFRRGSIGQIVGLVECSRQTGVVVHFMFESEKGDIAKEPAFTATLGLTLIELLPDVNLESVPLNVLDENYIIR